MSKLNTLKSLGSLFRSSINSTPAAANTSPVVDKILKHIVSSLDFSSALPLVKSHKRPQPSKPPSPLHLSSLVSIGAHTASCLDSDDPTSKLSDGLSVDLLDSEGDNGGKPSEDALEDAMEEDALDEDALEEDICEVHHAAFRETVMKEFNALLKICIENAKSTKDQTFALRQVYKAYNVLMSMKEQGFPIEEGSYGPVLSYLIYRGVVEDFHLFADVIRDGSASTLARLRFYEMLMYTRLNDLNALLKICIENAISTEDETFALSQVSKAYNVLMSMKEQGFPIEEESYGPLLFYLIDRGMLEQFHLFTDVIRDGSASTFARLFFYEMLLYARVNDQGKVQEFRKCTFTSDGDETIRLRTLFPGLWLAGVIADAYKVPEILETED